MGNALFKISDIYTGTLDPITRLPVQGLTGAKIRLQNEEVISHVYDLATDGLGEAFFSDLPAGRYKCRVSADNHQEKISRIWIKPGITATQEVFLEYNLVTVEWSVNEITILDKYEIVLTATYETDVPAPVLVLDPMSVALPKMAEGDVFFGEFTLTNHGLIRADNIKYVMPENDPYYHYEFLTGLPDSLGAKDSIRLPYRVVRFASADDSGTATGGGSGRCGNSGGISYEFACANGYQSAGSANFSFNYTNHDDCNNIGEKEDDNSLNVKDPTLSGIGDIGPGYGSMEGGGNCIPDCDETQECCSMKCSDCEVIEGCGYFCETVGSSVNLAAGRYSTSETDLSVKVPGGIVDLKREYYLGRWRWSHYNKYLSFSHKGLVINIEHPSLNSAVRDGIEYSGNVNFIHNDPLNLEGHYGAGTFYFHFGKYKIDVFGDGISRWEDKRGNWELYETDNPQLIGSRMTSYGDRNGVIGKLLYQGGADGKLIGIADRNDQQVVWFEYIDEEISAVYDVSNRRVEYGHTNGLLTSVKDVNGHEVFYEYNQDNGISKISYPQGKERIISYDENRRVSSIVNENNEGYHVKYDYNKNKKEFYTYFDKFGMIKETWYNTGTGETRVNINGRRVKTVVKEGRMYNTTDEHGNVTVREYDEWNNLTKVVNPDGTSVVNEYEHEFNNLIKKTDEKGIVTEFAYDGTGNLIRKTEAVGTTDERVTEYVYDSGKNLEVIRVVGKDGAPDAVTTMTYDELGNSATITDPENNLSRFTEHDVMGNVLTKIDAGNKIWRYT